MNLKYRGVSLDYTNTEYTTTTQRSSNLIANRNINITSPASLKGGAISITGSNLIAGENMNLDAQNINIQNGEYVDQSNTTGFGTYVTFHRGITGGAYASESSSSFETLTPSFLNANKININAANQTNIQASILDATDSINITTPKLNIKGDYQNAESESKQVGFSVTIYTTKNVCGWSGWWLFIFKRRGL